MIPEEKREAVARALREVFGVDAFEEIRMLTNRPRADLVYRMVVKGRPYLLRIIRRMADPTRHIANMRSADEAGLAPHIWYTSIEDLVMVTDFVEAAPFPVHDALVIIPAALRTLHALPPFAAVPDHLNSSCTYFLNDGPGMDGFLEKFRAASLVPKDEVEEVLSKRAEVAAVYPREHREMVSSHNDLKPENIAFDGSRVWLLDWEAAFLNDRYADLAVFSHYLVSNDAEETVYLQEYFGHAPDESQKARYFLIRQIAHLFYAMAYLFLGSGGKPFDHSEPVPEFHGFLRRIWEGEVNMDQTDMRLIYGRVHWNELLQNVRSPRFQESLRILSNCRERSMQAAGELR